jgi:peptidoglycan/xylan/chitin deacetylase (PgdA/CDA1 family)
MEAKKGNKNIFEAISVALVMVLLITASFFFYGRVIRENYYGTVGEFLGIFSNFGAAASAPLNLGKKVIILEGKATAKYFNKNTSEQFSIMWGNFLKQKNVVFDVVSQDDFANKNLDTYDILVLPFAVCLSDKDIAKIKEFASIENKGIILDGYTGARDENGKWREASFLSEIIGGYSIKEVKNEGGSGSTASIILDGNSLLSSNIAPGFRLEVNTYNAPLSAGIIEPRVEIDGYWEETPIVYKKKVSSSETGIVHGKYIGARFVWLGFTMGAVTGNLADQKAWKSLLDNIFNYVSLWPIVYKDRWPGGKKTAVLFAEDTEDKFENALNAAALFTEKNIPCTFFCVPELAKKYEKVFFSLYSHKNFEIGLHGIEVYQGQSLKTQEERLRAGKDTLEKIIGKNIRGFRPPLAVYDKNTVQALLKLNYDYIAGDDLKQASPETIIVKKNKGLSFGKNILFLTKFPKTSNDDYDIFERYKMQDKAKMLELLKQDFDNIHKVGGLYYYSFHTQLMAEEEYVDVLAKFIDYVKEKDVWITTFSEANDWSVKWSLGIDISSVQVSPNRTSIKVTNNSFNNVENVKINMLLPPTKKLLKAFSERLGVSVLFSEGKDGKVVFDIQNIKSDESITFDVEYE